MKRLLISITETMHESLRQIAFTERKSISEVVRELLRKGMETKKEGEK